MTKLEIGICDNEQLIVNYLSERTKEYFSRKEIDCTIHTSMDSDGVLKHASIYDIVLLDVEMGDKDISGIDIGKLLRQQNKRALIVYVTGYYGYIFKAQENHSFDYLIKPVEKEKLYKTLDDAIAALFSRKIMLTFFTTRGKRLALDQDDIYCFKLKARQVLLYTANNEYEIDISKEEIGEISERDDYGYTHQNYLVNFNKINSYREYTVTLTNNKEIPLADRRVKAFKMKFNMWLQKN